MANRSVGVGKKERKKKQVDKREQDYSYTYEYKPKKKESTVLKKSKGYEGLTKSTQEKRGRKKSDSRGKVTEEEVISNIKQSTEVNNATAIKYICKRICWCW